MYGFMTSSKGADSMIFGVVTDGYDLRRFCIAGATAED